MLLSTRRAVEQLKTWFEETGMLAGDEEVKQGLQVDLWGILTPNKENKSEQNKCNDICDIKMDF